MTRAVAMLGAAPLSPDDPAPLYLRLQERIKSAIERGDLRPLDALPGERDIAEAFQVSRVTVRKALSALVEVGLLKQRQGSGTFVASPPQRVEQALSRLTSFSEDMRLRGLAPTVRWLTRDVSLASPREAMRLSLSPSDSVCRLKRLRLAGGTPMAIELATIPTRFLPDPEEVDDSLYSVLEKRGVRPGAGAATPQRRQPLGRGRGASRRGQRRGGPCHRPPRFPRRRHAGRIHPVLVPGRRLRLRRRADAEARMTNEPGPTTLMAAEIREAPEAVERFFDRERATLASLGPRLRALAPPVVVTCARGSSDNAAGYFKYLAEILTGTPVASIGPSVASIYGASLRLAGSVMVSVSQSGRSPDIVALQAAARASGALTISVVNDAASPLAEEADIVLPLHAGVERSVAATKTFLASAVVLAAIVAEWRDDEALRTALRGLPATSRPLSRPIGRPPCPFSATRSRPMSSAAALPFPSLSRRR